MKTIHINELQTILENSEDYKKELSKYIDVIYTENGFDYLPKKNVRIISNDGSELYQNSEKLLVKDRRGFVVTRNQQWSSDFNNILIPMSLNFKSILNPIADLVINFERQRRIRKFFNKKQSGKYDKIVISVGDSWTQHPLNKDIIDILDEKHENLAIYCIARAGQELREIIGKKEYVSPLKTEKASVFILSAGGNDILDDVSVFTYDYDPKKSAKEHLNKEYYNKLIQLEFWYKDIFTNINLYNKHISRIIIHSYDYPIPIQSGDGRSGHWIGKNLSKKRNIKDHELQKAIAVEVINDIHAILLKVSQLPESSAKITLMDFRGKLKKVSNWYDEIHPNKASNVVFADMIFNAM